MTAVAAPPTPPVAVPDYPPEAGYFDNFGHFHPGPTRSLQGAPRPDADPGSLRSAAGQIAALRDTVAHHHSELVQVMWDLLEGRGQWYGPAATAFRTDVWQPMDQALGDIHRTLDDLAGKLYGAAGDIDQAYDDRRRAIEAAIVALVACGVLTLFTWGASDVVADAAAAAAAAECTRVVEFVASVGRVIAAEARTAFEGLEDLFRTFADLAALRNYPAAFNLATKLGQLQAIPVLAGAGSGVLFTVGVGDTNPLDVATAAVTGTVDAVGGSAGEEGDDAPPEFYQRSDGSVEEEQGGVVTVVPAPMPPLDPLGDNVIIDPRKFTAYSLDPGNPNNGGKWKGFRDLGYDTQTAEGRAASAENIMAQLRPQLRVVEPAPERTSAYGKVVSVNVQLTGPNGRAGTLVTIWQYDAGSSSPRLITNYLKVH